MVKHPRIDPPPSASSEITAVFARETPSLFAPPLRDLGVVARQQHLGNGAPLPRARARVLRVFEQTVLEALGNARLRLAHHAGNEPDASAADAEPGAPATDGRLDA